MTSQHVVELCSGVVIAVGSPSEDAAFTLCEEDSDDQRTVTVASVSETLDALRQRCHRWPQSAAVCADVLRAVDVEAPAFGGVITESLAYSTLQSGPEFARWLAERGPARPVDIPDPVQAERVDNTLYVRFNRPQRHNAFSTDARAALLEALEVARLDPSVTDVVLSGNGPSFCSGGDLAEFGTFADPATAHLARTRHSPALVLDELRARLGPRCRAEVHGQVLGSGLEMAAFCGVGAVAAGRRVRPAGAEPGADSRRRRNGEHHPQDRPMADRLPGALRPDDWTGDSTEVGPDRRNRVIWARLRTLIVRRRAEIANPSGAT